jgi:hypothetical protein
MMVLEPLLARRPAPILRQPSFEPAHRFAEPIVPANLIDRQIRVGSDH